MTRTLPAAAAVVLAGALGAAIVLAAPIGDQVQVSQMGTNQPVDNSVTAYNSQTGQTLVAWQGDDPSNGDDSDEDSIFVRLVDSAGNPVGSQARISDPGAPNFARGLHATYNAEDNRFAVVWSGGSGGNEQTNFQMLDAAGNEVGPDDAVIGNGPDDQVPGVAYNPAADRYLVVWTDNNQEGSGLGEVIAQQVDRTGAEVGTDDFQISSAVLDADDADIAYNPTSNQYLVVWDNEAVTDEHEISGQLIDATGAETGTNDFQISQQTAVGSSSDPEDAFDVDVVHNATSNEYLVTWAGDRLISTNPGDLENESEVFGQRLNAGGGELGPDFRITTHGTDGDAVIDAENPSIAHDSSRNEYLVVWRGDLVAGGNEGREAFVSCLSATGAKVGTDFRVSTHGPEGDAQFEADEMQATFNASTGEYQLAWDADVTPPDVDEIFGRRANCIDAASPAPTPTALTPVLGLTVLVRVLSGRVLVSEAAAARAAARVPGLKGREFVPLTGERLIPVGSFLDTRKGKVGLTSARDVAGTLQTGAFNAGVFQVLQSARASARGLTELRLKGLRFNKCTRKAKGKKASASARRKLTKRTVRKLSANANGRFRTRGRHSSATVRGTIWTVSDRCDGTLTRVKRGKVAVRDFRRKKTVVVKAGKRYLAKAKR